MQNNNRINIEPIFSSKEQKEKGFCEDSWFLIIAISNENKKIFYFNHDIDPLEFDNFNNFVESNIKEFYCPENSSSPSKIIKDNYVSISAYSGTIEEDFDEDTKKVFHIAIGKASIMEFHKGGFNQEKLLLLLKNIDEDLHNLEKDGIYEIQNNNENYSNRYKY